MRCPQCRTTGYTADELKAHIAKTGHVLPADVKEWNSHGAFPEQDQPTAPKLSKDELLAALKELGIQIPPPPTPPNNTGSKGGN